MKSIVKTTLLLACAITFALPAITAATPQTIMNADIGAMNATSNTSNSTATPSVGIVNPLTMYNSIGEMETDVKFKIETPSVMPVGYDIVDIASINKKIAQINYDKDASTPSPTTTLKDTSTNTIITYRIAKGNQDISGDSTEYPEEGTLKFNGNTVNLKGQDNKVNLATWTVNGMSYSLQFAKPISQTELVSIVATIHGAASRTVTTTAH